MERENKTYHTIEFERDLYMSEVMNTPCPFGVGDNLGPFKVNSYLCQRCVHFCGKIDYKDEIHCSYNNKKD